MVALKNVFLILKRLAALGISIAAAWALISEYNVYIKHWQSHGKTLVWTLKESLRFFEVWTNFAIFLVCIGVAFSRTSELFLSRHSTTSAVSSYALFMLALSPVYRGLFSPEFEPYLLGLFLFWWVIFSDHGGLRYRDALTWLCLPASYCALTYAGGQMMAFFPYSERGISFEGGPLHLVLLALVFAFSVVCLFNYIAGLIIIFLDRAISKIEFQS